MKYLTNPKKPGRVGTRERRVGKVAAVTVILMLLLPTCCPDAALAQSRASLYLSTARQLESRGKVELALQYLGRAIKEDPRSSEAYLGRGFILLRKGEVERAVSDFGQVIEIEPQNPVNYINRGLALSGSGASERAAADFRKGCELGDQSACDFAKELQAK